MPNRSWWANPVLRQVLLGTYSDTSPLAYLRGHSDILRAIFLRLFDAWRAHIVLELRGYVRPQWIRRVFHEMPDDEPGPCFVDFPPPLMHVVDGREEPLPFHVNMMPFIMGDIETLPESCRRYFPIVRECLRRLYSREDSEVGYLTIHEGVVPAGTSQRRGGLHVEISGGHGYHERLEDTHWGGGHAVEHQLMGGIFMASTVANSCGVWNVFVEDSRDIMGPLGDMEHFRDVLDETAHGYLELEANELIWMTDETPHESLPLPTAQFRQYFRLVTSNVSHWYADHSTPNPLGTQPTASIIHGPKFAVDAALSPAAQL
ncbi:Aste57867_15651 [Aphanomyces stellatus]|uniref:Aste57867_15651 protein n=1 Tax=Aphanomyces stellatus TaxID=120398 RepID=A0A485L3K8_9STRA|nr:hypothetical protein As57867_015595 [Aphanomyces stellatus]VFT92447.1 Aste57867_15651 [Aphanomyces stellatus]